MIDFLIDGESGFKHGCYLSELPNFPTSTRDVVSIDVQGREHGALTEFYGWKDSQISLSISVFDMKHVRRVMRQVVGWLYTAKKLSFSDDPTFYFRVKNVVMGEATDDMEVIGNLTVQFTIDPFQYQEMVPIQETHAFEVYNAGTMTSEPKITLYGHGTLQLVINGRRLFIINVNDSVVINTEDQTTIGGTINKETDMIGDFPYFDVGLNKVDFTADKILVEPEWRWLM